MRSMPTPRRWTRWRRPRGPTRGLPRNGATSSPGRLAAEELDRFDAVVLDPPRAGAREQARALAASKVPVAVCVSCNPDTFVRDAKILSAGGYRLVSLTPVDQFLWSAHLELAAVFVR